MSVLRFLKIKNNNWSFYFSEFNHKSTFTVISLQTLVNSD